MLWDFEELPYFNRLANGFRVAIRIYYYILVRDIRDEIDDKPEAKVVNGDSAR